MDVLSSDEQLQVLLKGALDLHRRGCLEAASLIYRKILSNCPNNFDSTHLLGVLCIQIGRPNDAIRMISRAITLEPNAANAHNNLGNALKQAGHYAEALESYDRAMRIKPGFANALFNKGIVLQLMGRIGEALFSYKQVVALQPDYPEAYVNLGNLLEQLNRFEDALENYEKALSLKPNHPGVLNNKGNVLIRLNRLEKAVDCYAQAIAMQPDYSDAIYSMSLAKLELRDFKSGWVGYEHRFTIQEPFVKHLQNIPVWSGEPLNGVLLVRGEQGLGDQVLFSSVLPDLKGWAKEVVVQVDDRLVPLLQRSFLDYMIIGFSESLPTKITAQITIGSLPKFFRQSEADFKKSDSSFLLANANLTTHYQEILHKKAKKTIGLSWRSFNNDNAEAKSIHLEQLSCFFKLPGIEVIDLQYGDTRLEKDMLKKMGCCFNESVKLDKTKEIDRLSSLIAACDLVVTVSNTTAHMAGALGRPTALLLPYQNGRVWYWSRDHADTAWWYPSVKVFQSANDGVWSKAINEVLDFTKSALLV